MTPSSVFKNIRTLASDPAILRHYVPWLLTKLNLRPAHFVIRGAKIGGFPNFSSYLGAVRNELTDEELAFMSQRIEGAEVIFDVGANFGAFVIPIARLGPDARIFAFEPNPTTAAALRQNLHRNGVTNVTIIEAAVSDKDGEVIFSDSTDPATNHILADGTKGVRVKSRSLFSVMEEFDIGDIDFMKIDVEGAELSVLEGASGLFREGRVQAGLIEICPGNLHNFGRSISELTAFFEETGYDLELLGAEPGSKIDESIRLENAAFTYRSSRQDAAAAGARQL